MLLALITTAMADPARTTAGDRVETDDYIVVEWSIDDAQSLETLRSLSGVEGVLALNRDHVTQGSAVQHIVKREAIDLPVVCDPVGRLSTVEVASPAQIARLVQGAANETVALNE